MKRADNTVYIASISYGKDSLAMLEAIKLLGYPLDRIISVQVWATDDIPADLPEMYEWKNYADKIIYEKYGIKVERISVDNNYERQFYKLRNSKKYKTKVIYGFPCQRGTWCNSELKIKAITDYLKSIKQNVVQYVGIASDEPERIARQKNIMPLVDIGWEEKDCRRWCEENYLLSPVYANGERDGCWFCHNQRISQLRKLRKLHPDLWERLKLWDKDSPVTFKPDGKTIKDLDKRFELEDRQMSIFELESYEER